MCLVVCLLCELGRKLFGGFFNVCLVCDEKLCFFFFDNEFFSFIIDICDDMFCFFIIYLSNKINGISVYIRCGFLFVFGFENVYSVEFFEIIWVGKLKSLFLEFFVIDVIVFVFGMVYDGLGID